MKAKDLIVKQDSAYYYHIIETSAARIGAMFGFDKLYYRLKYSPNEGIKKLEDKNIYHFFAGVDMFKVDFFVRLDGIIEDVCGKKLKFLSEKLSLHLDAVSFKDLIVVENNIFIEIDYNIAPFLYYLVPEYYSALVLGVKDSGGGFFKINVAMNKDEFFMLYNSTYKRRVFVKIGVEL